MRWKKKVSDVSMAKERLLERSSMEEAEKTVVKAGYVPVLVGLNDDEAEAERLMVPLKLFKKPCVKALLDCAAMEYGYGQQGILRVRCDVEQFRQVIRVA